MGDSEEGRVVITAWGCEASNGHRGAGLQRKGER